MATLYPIRDLAAKERFDYWQHLVSTTYVPTLNRALSEQPFDGSLEVVSKGSVVFSRITSLPIEYERRAPVDDSDHFFVCLSFCPQAFVSQAGRISRQGPGDIVLYDSTRPYLSRFPAGDDQLVLAVPRERLIVHLPNAEQFLNRTLERRSPLGSLANTLLMEVWNAPNLPQAVSERLNGSFLDALGSAFEASFQGDAAAPSSHQQRQLQRIQQFVLANLGDATLTVEAIALANHVSPRTLNRLFAQQGTTAIRWLWRQRLHACHEALLRRQFERVSDAALSFGFNNLSHFSRAFKQAYGVAPAQLLTQR